jgi:hypothetical protein
MISLIPQNCIIIHPWTLSDTNLQMLIKQKSWKQYFALVAFCQLMSHTFLLMICKHSERKRLPTFCARYHLFD